MKTDDKFTKWRFADILQWLENAFKATLKGEFLMKLRVDRLFLHILYTFFLIFMSIYLSLKIEKTLIRLESNRNELNNIEIHHAQKTVELGRMGRMTTIERMLEEKGSAVAMPKKPAERIRNKN